MSGICIFASEMFLNGISNSEDSDELPLRISVQDAGYSFSTTPTGYYRYMSEIENLDFVDEKLLSAFWYFLLALANLLLLIMMFVRMIVMMFLAAVGIIIVLLYAFGKEESGFWKYSDWLKWYLLVGSMQVILSFANRLLLESIIS